MEWVIERVQPGDYLRITTSGVFSLERQVRMFDEIVEFAEFRPGIPLLFDNRVINMGPANSETIRKSVLVIENFHRNHSKGRIAGLVNRDINFGFGRQFEIIAEFEDQSEFRIFYDETAAVEWLVSPSTKKRKEPET